MDETRAIARLPHLDVEITHRRASDDVEQLSIHLRARPSFRGFADYLETQPLLWPWLAFAPALAWQQAIQAFYASWLPGDPARLERQPERSQGHHDPDDKVHPFPGPAARQD